MSGRGDGVAELEAREERDGQADRPVETRLVGAGTRPSARKVGLVVAVESRNVGTYLKPPGLRVLEVQIGLVQLSLGRDGIGMRLEGLGDRLLQGQRRARKGRLRRQAEDEGKVGKASHARRGLSMGTGTFGSSERMHPSRKRMMRRA